MSKMALFRLKNFVSHFSVSVTNSFINSIIQWNIECQVVIKKNRSVFFVMGKIVANMHGARFEDTKLLYPQLKVTNETSSENHLRLVSSTNLMTIGGWSFSATEHDNLREGLCVCVCVCWGEDIRSLAHRTIKEEMMVNESPSLG